MQGFYSQKILAIYSLLCLLNLLLYTDVKDLGMYKIMAIWLSRFILGLNHPRGGT